MFSYLGPAPPVDPAISGCSFSGPILGSPQAEPVGSGASHTGAGIQVPRSWEAATTFSPLTRWATILGTEIRPQSCPNTNLCIPHPGPTTIPPGTPGPCHLILPLHPKSQAFFFPLGPTLFLFTPLWRTPTQGPVGPHLLQNLSSNSWKPRPAQALVLQGLMPSGPISPAGWHQLLCHSLSHPVTTSTSLLTGPRPPPQSPHPCHPRLSLSPLPPSHSPVSHLRTCHLFSPSPLLVTPPTLSPPSPCHPDLVLSPLHSCYPFSAHHPLSVTPFLSLFLPTTSSTLSPLPTIQPTFFPPVPPPRPCHLSPLGPQHPKSPLPVSALAPPLTSGSAGFRGGGPWPRLGPVRSLPAPPPALPLDSPFFFLLQHTKW